MKARIFMSAMLAALVIGGVVPQVDAQENASRVAVVDVASVFKAHREFNQALEAMKSDVEIFKGEITRESQRISRMSEELNSFSATSDRFKKLEEEISNESSKLAVYRNQQNREFLEREAKLYFDTYVDISRELSTLCDESGLTMVLRVDNQETDVSNRQSVLQAVNRSVVYKAQNVDITAMLIERVNR